MSAAVFAVQGAPIGNDCRPQALLVDVSPGLQSSTFPNRTAWAQAAILWNYVRSQDISATSQLGRFASNAPWSSITSDGPAADPSNTYATTQSGYTFDFAAQRIFAPPTTFIEGGQPSAAQIAQVNDVAHAALDRMYTVATAASKQRSQALQAYWRTTLSQKPEDLSTFMSIASGAPILLPFDASTTGTANSTITLVSNSTTAPFPPPLACYPQIDNNALQQINAIESGVFGLSAAQPSQTFDTNCFPDRPIYGVLDLLQLRLPFADSRSQVAKQAMELNRDTLPRVVVRNGEILSAFPGKASPVNTTVALSNMAL